MRTALRTSSLFVSLLVISAHTAAPAAEERVAGKASAATADATSHQMIAEFKVRSSDGKYGVQTLCADGEGNIVALVAPPRGYGAPMKNASGEVQVLTPEGKVLRKFQVDFHSQAVNVGPDGCIYVAGDGRVAKFDSKGKLISQSELQHVAEITKDAAGLRKRAEEQLKMEKESFTNAIKQLKDQYEAQKKKLEGKKAEELTASEKRQLEQYKAILQSYEQSENSQAKRTVEDVVASITGRLRTINGVAISPKDVFIVCGESKGYGYAVWRMGHDFKTPTQVLSAIGGCCGQMDVQVSGDDLVVAENTKHRFAKYTRDGKPLGAWGKRGKETEPDCFGSCCNPMNVRAVANGDVFTAESEGVVKRFSAKGDFLGTVGSVKLSGGCKNVAVAASHDGDRVYFCDQPGSRILVLAKRTSVSEK